MPITVKCARVGKVFRSCILSNADRRPRFVIQINVRCQHSADFGFFFGFCIVHLIPEPFQPLGGADLIGVCLRAVSGYPGVKCAAGDGAAAGDYAGKNAVGDSAVVDDLAVECAAVDGSVVDDLAVECAFFDGAVGGNGHFAFEHSLASACNGTGTVAFIFISQHDVAVNRATVGVKFPPVIRIQQRAGDV